MNPPPNNRTSFHQREAAFGLARQRRAQTTRAREELDTKRARSERSKKAARTLGARLLLERELECLPVVLESIRAIITKGMNPTQILCRERIPDYPRMSAHYRDSELVAMAKGLACSIRHRRLGGPLWKDRHDLEGNQSEPHPAQRPGRGPVLQQAPGPLL